MLLLALALFAPPTVARAEEPVETQHVLDDVLGPLTDDRLFQDAEIAVQVVDVATGEEVWAHHPDRALNPASTTKLLTAATALRTLGPSYTFRTVFYADELPSPDGVLEGPLYVKGGGDPTVVVEKLWKIARDLELFGITTIRGGLVLDESMFGPDHRLPGWDKKRDRERGPAYFPALSALSLNFNTIALVVRPTQVGKPAALLLETDAGPYVRIEGDVRTGRKGSRRRVQIERKITDDQVIFTLSGTVPEGAPPRKYYRTVDDPTRYFGHALLALLEERGIQVEGGIRLGEVPELATYLVELRSPPLASILMDMNKYSSNFMAEQVLRTVGAEIRGEGTTEAGLSVMREYLAELGFTDGFTLHNGSGLAREGALSPALLSAVLLDMARDPRVGAEFRASLAIAGLDGTLRRRLHEFPGRLRGKTGTLDGVHGLAGYIEAEDGKLYAFAFLANGFRGGSARVKRLHDAFARRMFEVSADATAEGAP